MCFDFIVFIHLFHPSKIINFLSSLTSYAYNKVERHKIKQDIGGNQCPIDTQLTARSAVARKADSNLPSLRPSRVGYFLSLDTAMTVTISDANAIINVSASAMVIISGTWLLKIYKNRLIAMEPGNIACRSGNP
jgi:hypothetical protein